MDTKFAIDECYCNSPTTSHKWKTKRPFIQAKASKNQNVTVYDNCIVFNKLGFETVTGYTTAVIERDTNGFIIWLNNGGGCKINKNGTEPRLNIPNMVNRFKLQKGKFQYVIMDNQLVIDYNSTTEKYDNEINN